MKTKKLSAIVVCFVSFVFCLYAFSGGKNATCFANSVSEILVEQSSRRVLYSNNARERRGIASTTKILTALCVLENCALDKVVKITEEMTGAEGSSIYLRVGDERTVEQLLYGLMLRSGNDAATALAITVSGNVKDFASLMNETARKCGATESNFINPHGLDDEKHYSTALDMALITARAFENEIFKKIVGSKTYKFQTKEGETVVFVNKNKLLSREESFNGVKTGYTKRCGRCLVSSRNSDGMQLICIVLNCAPMFERSEELLKFGSEKFAMRKILSGEESYAEITPREASAPALGVSVKRDVFYPLTDEEYNLLEYSFVPAKEGFKLSEIGEYAGKINVYSQKDLIYSSESFIIIPH